MLLSLLLGPLLCLRPNLLLILFTQHLLSELHTEETHLITLNLLIQNLINHVIV